MPEPHHRFLRACLRLPTDRVPIWIMRQAGRYLPEYMEVRRQAGDFLSLCKNPELATQVTLQPVDRFGLDAAILFSDILVVPEAMGMGLHFGSGEGPILDPAINAPGDVEKLRVFDPEQELDYVMNTIRTIRRELADRVPLIGFSGSPWTLATYMVEGGSSKNFSRIKGMMYDRPEVLQALLDRLVDAVTRYLNAQIRHGVQAVQIFDTWGGVLGHDEFLEFSLESMRRIVAGLERTGPDGTVVPVILFAKGCGSHLERMAASGCDVVGLDWTTDLAQARLRVEGRVALQGNMDPAVLSATPERIRREAERTLKAYGPHPGHVFNLGHGITPDCAPRKVTALVEAVQGFSFGSASS
ncbi:MAG: uroporphyrinogen decarboxylase [Magnetococcales bacterium]|nr:uroporphyrinogen decarboxylase [Magnetococcales bacterium]